MSPASRPSQSRVIHGHSEPNAAIARPMIIKLRDIADLWLAIIEDGD